MCGKYFTKSFILLAGSFSLLNLPALAQDSVGLNDSTGLQDSIRINDAEIAHIALTANQIDIDYAAIALKKGKGKPVIDFAETMIRDHKAVIEKATELAHKLKVTPEDNKISKSLLDAAKETENSLNKHSDKEFDKAYIDNEVAYHKAVIRTLENTLIPNTTNSELKTFLEQILPNLKAHLLHAKTTQKELAAKK